MRIGAIAALGALAAASCATVRERQSDLAAAAEVRAGISYIAAAAALRDAEGTISLVSRDLQLIHPTRGTVNYERFAAGMRAGLSGPARLTVTAEIEDVVVGGDLAIASITWLTAVTAPDGTVTRRGERDQEVWRRESDGRWRLFRGASFPLPAERASP